MKNLLFDVSLALWVFFLISAIELIIGLIAYSYLSSPLLVCKIDGIFITVIRVIGVPLAGRYLVEKAINR